METMLLLIRSSSFRAALRYVYGKRANSEREGKSRTHCVQVSFSVSFHERTVSFAFTAAYIFCRILTVRSPNVIRTIIFILRSSFLLFSVRYISSILQQQT